MDENLSTLNYIFTSISIVSSLLIVIAIIVIKVKDVNFSNRVSLRLIMYISITEIFFSIFQLLKFNQFPLSTISTSMIIVTYLSSWGYVFCTLLICFLIMTILINIQLILLYNYKDYKDLKLKEYYLIIPFSSAIILSILPLPFGGFNFDQNLHYFWYSSIAWEWLTYNGWITLTILYCMSSIIVTSISLFKSTQSKTISSYIARITFYSLIPILAYSPTIISKLAKPTYNNNSILHLSSLIFMSSQSIFTLIIFLFDPIIDEFISERRMNTKHKQHVLENIQKGVYVTNIYNIDRELPSNTDNTSKKNYRNTIYNYAKNAKNRISGITTALSNKKKSTIVKKDIFNLNSDDDDILCLL